MKTRDITCIICPNGCRMKVLMNGDQVLEVHNNMCKRGHEYAVDEATSPKRILTTTVLARGVSTALVPVRTVEAIPKDKLLQAMEELKTLSVSAPINMGDVVLANLLDTGVAVIATRAVRD